MTRSVAVVALTAAIVSTTLAAQAQTESNASQVTHHHQLTVSPSMHRYFGSLQTVHGRRLAVLLRSGHVLDVDATKAFALVRVAEPLYFRKPIVVEGNFEASGVLDATAIKRAVPRVQSWGADH